MPSPLNSWSPEAKTKGSLAIVKGNKVHLEADGHTLYVSNGSEGRHNDKDIPATPKKISKHLVKSMEYSGVLLGVDGSRKVWYEKAGVKGIFRTSALKLGKKEKVGEHDAQVVEYQLDIKSEFANEALAVKLWLDVSTGLPLKRSVTGKFHDKEIDIVETYSKFVIDEKIDEKRFEIPK